MKTSAALIPVALALAAAVLVSGPGAQAAPTVIKTCQTVTTPGSYVLTKDLFPTGDCLVITAGATNLSTTGDCLVISASSVSIDLAGFSIVGPGNSTNTTGILANSGAEFTTVRNGSISNFSTCVQLENDGTALVEYLRVFACTSGIQASGIVTGNIVEGPGAGIQSNGLISGNRVLNAGIVAVNAGSSISSTVIGNTITSGELEVSCPANLIDNTVLGDGTFSCSARTATLPTT
jgi:hypothetical protein